MTSFSTYASKFLSSGAAATASVQQQFAHQSSIGRQFGSSNYPGAFQSEGDESDDVFGVDESAPSSRNRHHLPQLSDKRGTHTRQYSTKKEQQQLLLHTKQEGISHISDDDEEREDEGEAERGYRTQRSRVAVPSGSSLLIDETRPVRNGARRDEYDPFLAEDDLQSGRAESTTSASSNHTRRIRGPSSEAKARGWMAHVADSSSNASAASFITNKAIKSDLPHDIYRDPDEDGEEVIQSGYRLDKGKRTSRGGNQRDRYSIYDDVDSSASTSITDSDESEVQTDQRRGKWNKSRRAHQKVQISKAAGSIGSSLREPLLSSAGSEHLSKPPGAFKGQTSRITSTDIYTYPHPPAKAGWTPWAPGNRVAWGEYKDKVALLLWCGLVGGTLISATWMVLGAKVNWPIEKALRAHYSDPNCL